MNISKIFTENDLQFLQQRGSDPEEVAKQFGYFETGFDFADLQRAATIGDGITRFGKEECAQFLSEYSALTENKRIVKFVPASGAASRMFKEVFTYMENEDENTRSKALKLLQNLKHYAFYDELNTVMQADGLSLQAEIEEGHYQLILQYLLTKKGLDYGSKPKAVLQFHRYGQETRTALEEHLVEAANYARSTGNQCFIHFTISPQHQALFEGLIAKVLPKYEQRFGVKYHVECSTQRPATDTLAATEDNQPFRDNQGNLLFRPGGHGALIYNLNEIKADLVFVKNIDNVFYDSELQDTIIYKKVLAVYLLKVQKQIFTYLSWLQQDAIPENKLAEIKIFIEQKLSLSVPAAADRNTLCKILNRPLRVCGMVKNEGEPGGGPYFVKNREGECSLQIVESSQMDMNNPQQKQIVANATHFNPVDMVCSFLTCDHHYFNLLDFVDPETGFISSKSYEGKPLKAMELPGLWNGAMAKWNTIFVEVPLTTFHPVKTMFDLEK